VLTALVVTVVVVVVVVLVDEEEVVWVRVWSDAPPPNTLSNIWL